MRRSTRRSTEFRLNEAATTLYEFIWGIVCDWYVELSKPILQGDDGAEKDETRAVTAFVLRETVKLLHPVMPFITEELWDKLGHRAEHGDADRPALAVADGDDAAAEESRLAGEADSDIRSVTSGVERSAGAKLACWSSAERHHLGPSSRHRRAIVQLARIEADRGSRSPKGSLQFVVDEATLRFTSGDVIDFNAETSAARKEIGSWPPR